MSGRLAAKRGLVDMHDRPCVLDPKLLAFLAEQTEYALKVQQAGREVADKGHAGEWHLPAPQRVQGKQSATDCVYKLLYMYI